MKFNVEINIGLDAIYDTETQEFEVVSCVPKIIKKEEVIANEWVEHKLSKTQVNFGILTLGARSMIGKQIPLGEMVTVQFVQGDVVIEEKQIVSHRSIKARLDGLTSLYCKMQGVNCETRIMIRYIYDLKTLQIKIIAF